MIKNLGFQFASSVSFLKTGIPGDDYSHIIRFRREAYIFSPNDNFELQTSIFVQHEDNDNRIFLSTNEIECFICRLAMLPLVAPIYKPHTMYIPLQRLNPKSTTLLSTKTTQTKKTTPLTRVISKKLSANDRNSQPELTSEVVVSEKVISLPE